MGGPARWFWCGIPLGQAGRAGRRSPEVALSCDGQGHTSIGVRAFSALEGYAGRNWRNGAGFSWKTWKTLN
jgi:hypothetical protein